MYLVGILCVFFSAVVFANGEKESATMTLKLGHNFTESHPVHIALDNAVERIKEKSEGRITITIFPNATLGKDTEMIEQVRNGLLDFMKVSASFLEGFDENYAVFSLPYMFKNDQHFYAVMNSDFVAEMFEASLDKGFMPITFFDAGTRNFYTKTKFIETPEDLEGVKVRVMNSNVATRMIQLLGGTPTIIPFNDVYVSIQQGVVDGAENNMLALTEQKHGEVAKFYSMDGHTTIPDLLIVGAKTWAKLDDDAKTLISTEFKAASDEEIILWKEQQAIARQEAEKLGVQFMDNVDKEAFFEKVQPLIEEFKQDAEMALLIDQITALKEQY